MIYHPVIFPLCRNKPITGFLFKVNHNVPYLGVLELFFFCYKPSLQFPNQHDIYIWALPDAKREEVRVCVCVCVQLVSND